MLGGKPTGAFPGEAEVGRVPTPIVGHVPGGAAVLAGAEGVIRSNPRACDGRCLEFWER